MEASEILFTPGFWNKIHVLFHVSYTPQRFLFIFFPFPFLDIDVFQNFYVAFPLSLPLYTPPSPLPSSWNVILSMKYDGQLKRPWWSIALLDFHSCQWQKLTNSDIEVPECVSLWWLVLCGIAKVWVSHPTCVPTWFFTQNQLQKSTWKIPKHSTTEALKKWRGGLCACVQVCGFFMHSW